MPTLTAPNPAAVHWDASRAGAHHAHADRLVAAILAADPTVHVRVAELGWTVRLAREPITEPHGLGEVTISTPRPWTVRDGACYARATEWDVHRTWPLSSPSRYARNVTDAARLALTALEVTS